MTVSIFTNLFWRSNYFFRFFGYKYLSIINLKKKIDRWHIIYRKSQTNAKLTRMYFKLIIKQKVSMLNVFQVKNKDTGRQDVSGIALVFMVN